MERVVQMLASTAMLSFLATTNALDTDAGPFRNRVDGAMESGDARCIDTPSYRSAQGLPCEAYAQLDCKRLGLVGLSDHFVEQLSFHCPRSCKVAECVDDDRQAAVPSLSSSYVSEDLLLFRESEQIRRALRPKPRNRECNDEDDPKFTSPQGGKCANYEGLECTMFWEIGFTLPQVYDLVTHCPVACGVPCGTYTLSPSQAPSTAPTLSMQPSYQPSSAPSGTPSSSAPSGTPSSSPSSRPSPIGGFVSKLDYSPSPGNGSSSGPNLAAIIVPIVLGLSILAAILYIICRRRKRRDAKVEAVIKNGEENQSQASKQIGKKVVIEPGADATAASLFNQENIVQESSSTIEEVNDKLKRYVSVKYGTVTIEAILKTSSSMSEENDRMREFVKNVDDAGPDAVLGITQPKSAGNNYLPASSSDLQENVSYEAYISNSGESNDTPKLAGSQSGASDVIATDHAKLEADIDKLV